MHETPDTLERGLRHIAERWQRHGTRLISRRLEGALGRSFRFESPGSAARILELTHGGAAVRAASGQEASHATFRLSRKDWDGVFSGRWSVMSIVLAGRAPFPKHERRYIMQLSMLLQTLLLLED